MELETDRKRKKVKQRQNDENRAEIRPKRARTRSRSPSERREKESRRKRRLSKSKSPDVPVKQERRRDDAPKELEVKKEAPVRKNKETDMLNTRTGGAYIPPARLRMMQAQITDKSSVAYQRLAWEALKKSIHGHINKINVGNIGIIIKELLKENIVRGRGLLCRSVIQAQAASPTFTNVYAALVAAVNSRFPNIGELLLKRLVIQFKRGFKRNDKPICISAASFIAHLVNQRVAHEILALELLTLLVETPTDDSVEVSIAFLKECGQKLTEVSSKGVNAIFEMLRNILHEGQLDKRVQYMIEVMFQVWKDGFKDHPALIEELELVQEEEQFTHLLMLDDATDPQDILNVFKHDDKYEENEQKYKTLSREILGSDAESGEEDGSGSESGSDESDDEEEEGEKAGPVTIIDNTETNLVALRRTIYLTINSSLDFEECAHKLMKMQLKPGQEIELCHMFLDCCAEQRTYEKFYGLLAQRFCNINRIYIGPFEEIFKDSYATAHRLDTNRLRNVSKFFAHLLFTDSISWEVLECVRLNEEDTTSSSRIYIKILFQELAEYMGLKKLNDRLKDQTLQGAFSGIFPRDNPKNTRFSINFFTSIGLGGLTDELREHLKQMPKNVPPAITEINVGSDSSSSGSSSSSSSSDDSSESSSDSEDDEEEGNKNKKDNKSKSKKDKNSKKNKSKSPEPAKEKSVERWGHDGFYDTYGTDARRTESGTQIQQRDKDNFVMPRNRRDRNDRQPERDNYRDEREGNKRSNHSEENYTDRTRRDRNEDDSRRLLNEILGPKKTRDDSRSDSDDRKNSDRRRHERDDGDSRRQEESRNGSDDARDSDKRRRDRYDDDDSRKTRNLETHSSRNIRREELNRGSRDSRRDREEVDTRKESRDERRDKEERDSRNSTRGRDFERDDGDSRREKESRNGSDGDRDSDKRRRDRYDDDDFRKTRDSERDSSKNTRREEPNRGRRDREEVDTRKESRDERSDKEERDSRYSTRDRNFEKEKQEVTRKKNDYDRDTEIRKNRHEEGISSRDSEKKRNKEDSDDEHTDKRRRKQDIKKEYEREERDSKSESECKEQETEERTRRSKKKKGKSKKSKDSDSDGGEKKRSKKSKKKYKSP